MIRIQMGCLECGQLIDGTFAARSVVGIVAAFDDVHLYEKCRKEPKDGGEEEGKPVAAAPDAGDGGTGEAGSETGPGKSVH